MISNQEWMHYNPDLELVLPCNASLYGLGSALSQILPHNSLKPVSYTSRTLSSSEISYSQLDKEAQAFVFGVKYFHQYLYNRLFSLITDHKPLLYILGPKSFH